MNIGKGIIGIQVKMLMFDNVQTSMRKRYKQRIIALHNSKL